MASDKPITAHELGRLLLAGEDLPVFFENDTNHPTSYEAGSNPIQEAHRYNHPTNVDEFCALDKNHPANALFVCGYLYELPESTA